MGTKREYCSQTGMLIFMIRFNPDTGGMVRGICLHVCTQTCNNAFTTFVLTIFSSLSFLSLVPLRRLSLFTEELVDHEYQLIKKIETLFYSFRLLFPSNKKNTIVVSPSPFDPVSVDKIASKASAAPVIPQKNGSIDWKYNMDVSIRRLLFYRFVSLFSASAFAFAFVPPPPTAFELSLSSCRSPFGLYDKLSPHLHRRKPSLLHTFFFEYAQIPITSLSHSLSPYPCPTPTLNSIHSTTFLPLFTQLTTFDTNTHK